MANPKSPDVFDQLSQMYPPKPKFTANSLPGLRGKVYVVTGANSGVGKELAQILYSKHAKVYIAARSKERSENAIHAIRVACPKSQGELIFIHLDLADLSTIAASAQKLVDQEPKLHVLFNNAGVMKPEPDAKTVQGYELQLGVNNIGTHLFTKLLTPLLVQTARTESPGTIRVVWVSSSAGESPFAPEGGVPMDNLDYHNDPGWFRQYAISKAGNYLQGAEFARRYKRDGVVSVALNPGNLNSELWRNQGAVMAKLLKWFVLHDPIKGAYTELYAGLSPDITLENSGAWIAPFGRLMRIRKDLKIASITKAEGGSGIGEEFWEWNENQVQPYL